jgi:hypothetical protein
MAVAIAEGVAAGSVSLGCGLRSSKNGRRVEILRKRRVHRVQIGCVGRRLSVLAQDKVGNGCCSLSDGKMDGRCNIFGNLVHKMLKFVPTVLVAWGYCAVLPSSAWSMKKQSFQESVPKTSVGLMIGDRYGKEMSQDDMDALMNYYLDPPSGGRGTRVHKAPSQSSTEKSGKMLANKNKTSETKQQHRLSDCDSEVARVEFRAAFAVAAVCAVAVLFWRWKLMMMGDEASYGIENEIRNLDLTPIRDVDTGESKEEKEQVRMEAMKRIERAKRAEEMYMKQQVTGEEEVIEETKDVPSTVSNSVAIVREPPAPLVVATEPTEKALMVQPTTKDVHPGLIAFALMSVIIDDISKEIKNQPKTVRPESRVLSCSSNRKHAGKSMLVSSPRVKILKKNTPASHSEAGKHQNTDLLLAPIAPLMKSVSGKPKLSVFSDKYNPMHEFHEFVSKPDTTPSAVRSDRDPFRALVEAIKAFDGFKSPESMEKFDPISNLDKVQQRNKTDQDVDPVISFIRAAAAFDGLRASEFIAKYDPLQGIEKISPEYGSSEYNMFQGLLRANPTGSKDYSIIQALLKADPDASHYDIWKAVVNVSPPEIGEKNELLSAADSFIEYLRKPMGIDFSKYDVIHNFLGKVGPTPKDE